MTAAKKPLVDLFGPDVCIDAVDIGANPIASVGVPPYQALLDAGQAKLVGFEPNLVSLKLLNAKKGPHELYLPHSVVEEIQNINLLKLILNAVNLRFFVMEWTALKIVW